MTDSTNAGGHAAGKLWGGRFASPSDPTLERLSRSPEAYFDLVGEDVRGSVAHAGELTRAGLLTEGERDTIVAALEQIAHDHRCGHITPAPTDEDVHGYLERELTTRLGPLAGKLRAGRSRNDQAANDLRLYLRRTIPDIARLVGDLVETLRLRAADSVDVVVPGFTHLQPAQPILLSHQLMAHAFALTRDLTRFRHAWEANGLSPLGAAALAGTSIHADATMVAREMGFEGAVPNSVDAVASRDHVADYLYAAAMLGTDLSRLCEELCLWSSRQFGWVRLDDGFSTGSSIMPQKKNPDIAELTRGKAGRLQSNLIGLLVTLKSLPFAYNRDLAEDKHYVFDTTETLQLTLPALTGMIRTLGFESSRMREQAADGFTLATELADWIAEQGIPFSEAHDITGKVVFQCESRGVSLEDLTATDLAEIDSRLTPDALSRLTLESAIDRRGGHGGTARVNIDHQQRALLDSLRQQLAAFAAAEEAA